MCHNGKKGFELALSGNLCIFYSLGMDASGFKWHDVCRQLERHKDTPINFSLEDTTERNRFWMCSQQMITSKRALSLRGIILERVRVQLSS